MLKPLLTEKSLDDAKKGKFTFLVNMGLRKNQIAELINMAFDVHVRKVWTINLKREIKKNLSGREVIVKPVKKVFVTLAEKEKISLFEEKK